MGAILLASISLSIPGCGDGGAPPTEPPSDTTDGGDGTVQRATLTVTVTVEGDAATVAEAIGSGAQQLEGAQVTIQRVGESTRVSATTDAEGTVAFDDLLEGHYTLSVVRFLSPEEVSGVHSLGASFEGVNTFGGGGSVRVDPPDASASVQAELGRRGSLVMSEVFPAIPSSSSSRYRDGQFLEVYNNADTTIYLDGKVLAFGLWFVRDEPNSGRPCSVLAEWREDPEGIWSEQYLAFPGSGGQHPLNPGDAAVVAMDAVDHREFWDGLPDLSDAEFETVGTADTDNPAVPNMIDLGPRPWHRADGEGWSISTLNSTLVLTETLDPDELMVDQLPVSNPEYHRIPKEKILDIGVFTLTPELRASIDTEFCQHIVHPSFDTAPAALLDEFLIASVVRKPLGRTPEGRVILQRTGSSASDFEMGGITPGSVR